MPTSAHPRRCCAPAASARGWTIAELLVVVLIVGIVAAAAVPVLNADDVRLDAAQAEVGNALRFALSESARTGGYVLVDAGSTPGRVLVVNSDVAAARGSDVIDPLTKRTMDIDVAGSTFSTGVSVSPRFVSTGGAHTQLLIGPGPSFWAARASVVMGTLQPGSGVDLTLGSHTVTVSIDSASGRVSAP